MPTRTLIAIACLGWFAVWSRADEPATSKRVDQRFGAAYGGLCVTRFGLIELSSGRDNARHGLPGFRFLLHSDDQHPKWLPVPVPIELDPQATTAMGVPAAFGLDWREMAITDARFFSRTDGGFPKLPPLPVPFGLDFLQAMAKTDADLKDLEELKDFKDLSYLASLCFVGTPATDEGLRELMSLRNVTTVTMLSSSLRFASSNFGFASWQCLPYGWDTGLPPTFKSIDSKTIAALYEARHTRRQVNRRASNASSIEWLPSPATGLPELRLLSGWDGGRSILPALQAPLQLDPRAAAITEFRFFSRSDGGLHR